MQSPKKAEPSPTTHNISPAKRARPAAAAPAPAASRPANGADSIDDPLDPHAQVRILRRTNEAMKEREKTLRAEIAVRSENSRVAGRRAGLHSDHEAICGAVSPRAGVSPFCG